MAIVVRPEPSPWDKIPAAIDALMKPIEDIAEKKNQEHDKLLLQAAGNDPAKIPEIATQFKSKEFKDFSNKIMIKNLLESQQQPTTVLDPYGKPTGEKIRGPIHQLPASATTPHGVQNYVDPRGNFLGQFALGDPRIPAGAIPEGVYHARTQEHQTEVHQKTMEELSRERLEEQQSAREDKKGEVDNFRDWSEPAKENAYFYNMLTGKWPSTLGRGEKQNSQAAKGLNEYMAKSGIKPTDIALMQSQFKADQASLRTMQQQSDNIHMNINNLDAQVNKLTGTDGQPGLLDNLTRSGVKIANIPISKFASSVKGSQYEAVVDQYLAEAESEISKIASGSTGSVAQPSDALRERWKKVFDKTLPVDQLKVVLQETKNLGQIRKNAVDDQLKTIQDRIDDPAKYREVLKRTGKGGTNVDDFKKAKSGETKTIGGVTYFKASDGKWYEGTGE